MKVLISGSHGLIGSALVTALEADGHEVLRLVRTDPSGPGEIPWDLEQGTIEAAPLEGLDAVVHLAGENIAGGRWTPERKQRIHDSRVNGTRLLAATMANLQTPPQLMICASAIGYYGDRGQTQVDEASQAGSGFLTELCLDWEAACEPVRAAGIRLVTMRLGIVLSDHGGALAKMLPPFRTGLAGPMGNGKQFMSWIALDDVVGVVQYALTHKSLNGPVNLVTPNPVTNRVFSKTLGHVLHRPAFLPLPAFAARMAFGEMADELLLASTLVKPSRLLSLGYQFRYPKLEGALKHILHKAA